MFKNTATNNIDFIHPLYSKHEGQFTLCRNLFEGLDSSLQYLYQSTNENEHDFRLRQQLAILDPIFERIVTAQVGQIYRKPVELEDVPEPMIDFLDEIGFETILRDATKNALIDGKSYLMVDLPADGGKPYILNVYRSQLINWRKDLEGVYSLTVIRELYQVEDGYKLEYQPQYREIASPSGNHNIWRKSSGGWEIHNKITTSYDDVPLYECDLGDIPPNYDIALGSRKMFNDMSMIANSLRKSCDPSLLTVGLDLDGSEDIKLGVNSTINSSNPEARVEWVELKGQSLPIAKQDLEDQKNSMAERALQLQSQSISVKTATQVNKESSESNARLTDISVAMEELANKVYSKLYELLYSQEAVGTIRLAKDFKDDAGSETQIEPLKNLWLAGAITHETLLSTLQEKELLTMVEDIQAEIKATALEGMANVQEQDKSED